MTIMDINNVFRDIIREELDNSNIIIMLNELESIIDTSIRSVSGLSVCSTEGKDGPISRGIKNGIKQGT